MFIPFKGSRIAVDKPLVKDYKRRTADRAGKKFLSIFLPLTVAVLLIPALYAQEEEKVSEFGKYQGYSQEIYDSWVRHSQYITVRDGTKLAVDVFRPARERHPVDEAFPVLWTHTRYRRAYMREDKLHTALDSPLLQTILKRGYVIAAVDVRGAGASFGTYKGVFTREETQDAYEIIQWLANQPWCDGNIGMYGGSYLGITQLMAASTQPPQLKAIFPVVSLCELYDIAYPGGIFRDDFIRTWSELTKQMDTVYTAAPVDGDQEGELLKEAIEAHQANFSIYEVWHSFPFRNSKDESTGTKPYYDWNPSNFIKEINKSGVAVYLWGGWYDSFTRDQFLWFRNLKVPKKMTIGPWSHAPRDRKIAESLGRLYGVEILRWYDYWLKGIDNGIMDEAPLNYHVMGAPEGERWRTAKNWPLPGEKQERFYFHEGSSGSVNSVNDGVLLDRLPEANGGIDDYVVDYTTTTGQSTRWDNAVGGGFEYPDMTANDRKALTYTTAPLASDIEVTGHPVVHLWISSTAEDGDVFGYLEEVDAEGVSHYITEGKLKASYRAEHKPPYDYLGLPYHRGFDKDIMKLTPGEPEELVFDLHPTSNIFDGGHRIRVTITCADKDNALTPELSPPPKVSIYRSENYASYISLPLITPVEEQAWLYLGIIVVVLIIVIVLIIIIKIGVGPR